MRQAHLRIEDFLFSIRLHDSDHLSTRQNARIAKVWVTMANSMVFVALNPDGNYSIHGTLAAT